MSQVNTWTFLLLLCVNSVVCSNQCIWLQDNSKDLSNLLRNFQYMTLKNETSGNCLTSSSLLDAHHLNTSQDESAAITMREFFYQSIQLYTKHQEKLVSNQTVWEQFQEDLHHQANLLEDCISGITEKWLSVQKIREYFSSMEKILEEQDDELCTRRIIHVNINRNLLRITNLSALIRKRHFKKTHQ